MSEATVLVRVRLEPYERSSHTRWGTEPVRVSVRGPNTSGVIAELHRFPVTALLNDSRVLGGPRGRMFVDEHLVAGFDQRDASWLSAADVVVRRAAESEPAPWSPADVHARFPGCLVAALVHRGQGCVVTTATGWQARFTPLRVARPGDAEVDTGDHVAADAWSYASLVHAWMVSGRPLGILNSAVLIVANGLRTVRVSASRTSWGVDAAIA